MGPARGGAAETVEEGGAGVGVFEGAVGREGGEQERLLGAGGDFDVEVGLVAGVEMGADEGGQEDLPELGGVELEDHPGEFGAGAGVEDGEFEEERLGGEVRGAAVGLAPEFESFAQGLPGGGPGEGGGGAGLGVEEGEGEIVLFGGGDGDAGEQGGAGGAALPALEGDGLGGGEAGGGEVGLVGQEGFDGFQDLLIEAAGHAVELFVEAGGEAGLFGLAEFAGPAVLEEGEDGAEGGDDGEPRPLLPGLPHVFPPHPIVDRFLGRKPS